MIRNQLQRGSPFNGMKAAAPFYLQRVGETGLGVWAGGQAMLSFLGESVVALGKLVWGRAQFRWSDTLLVMQQCGPEALGIVALINFLIGMILAFVGATELTQFGASIYAADLVAVAAQSVSALVDFLKKHPNALIAGRELPNHQP